MRTPRNKIARCASEASFWIRTMQSWAGAGWGTQFVPRVGTEVVVGFDGGDLDKPIVLGGLYNGTHPPPFALPRERSVSGIRTHTTPGGHDGNELSFEDRAGHQRIVMQASRDLEVAVAHDRSVHVAHEDTVRVDNNRTVRVDGTLHTAVNGRHTLRVDDDSSTTVTGTRRIDVRGVHETRARGGLLFETESGSTWRVGGNATHLVGTADAPRALNLHTEGSATIFASNTVRVTADQELVLSCGASTIHMTPESIALMSPELLLQGESGRVRLDRQGLRMQSDSAVSIVGETVAMVSAGAAVALGDEARVDGSRILLNSPESASDELDTERTPPTTIVLCDDAGQPLAYQRYRIVMEDGSETSGMLDRDGRAVVELESGGTIYFPGVENVAQA